MDTKERGTKVGCGLRETQAGVSNHHIVRSRAETIPHLVDIRESKTLIKSGDGDGKESAKKTLASFLCHLLEEAFVFLVSCCSTGGEVEKLNRSAPDTQGTHSWGWNSAGP